MQISLCAKQLWQIVLGFALLISGGMIYIMYRTNSLVMFGWFDAMNIDVTPFRSDPALVHPFVLYSLPDGLWLCSYILIIMALWRNRLTTESLICASLIPVYAFGWELLQAFGIKSGVFDILDIISYIGAILIAFLIGKFNKID